MDIYVLNYSNEQDFKKRERVLKKYNMLAYKKLMFEVYPLMRQGEFTGTLVDYNKKEEVKTYEFLLPNDYVFNFEGVKLIYAVYTRKKEIMLNAITISDEFLNKCNNIIYNDDSISIDNDDQYIFNVELVNFSEPVSKREKSKKDLASNKSDNSTSFLDMITNYKFDIYNRFKYLSKQGINQVISNCFDNKRDVLEEYIEITDKNSMSIYKKLYGIYEYAQRKKIGHYTTNNVYLLSVNKSIPEEVARIILEIGDIINDNCFEIDQSIARKRTMNIELFQYSTLNFIYKKYVDKHFDLVSYFNDSEKIFLESKKSMNFSADMARWCEKCKKQIKYWDDLLYDYRNVTNYFCDTRFNVTDFQITPLNTLKLKIKIVSMPIIELNPSIKGYLCGFMKVFVYENDSMVGEGILSGYGNVFFDKNNSIEDGAFDWNLENTSFNLNTEYNVICKMSEKIDDSSNLEFFVQPLKLWIVGE